MGMKLEHAIDAVITEYGQVCAENAPFNSAHEGYAVLLEEMDELKAEVWKKRHIRDINRMRKEAVQVAAMALCFLTDVKG